MGGTTHTTLPSRVRPTGAVGTGLTLAALACLQKRCARGSGHDGVKPNQHHGRLVETPARARSCSPCRPRLTKRAWAAEGLVSRRLTTVSCLSSRNGAVQAIQDQVLEGGVVLPVRSGDVECCHEEPLLRARRCNRILLQDRIGRQPAVMGIEQHDMQTTSLAARKSDHDAQECRRS